MNEAIEKIMDIFSVVEKRISNLEDLQSKFLELCKIIEAQSNQMKLIITITDCISKRLTTLEQKANK